MTLVARKGLPLPTLANYTYLSANPGTNEEFDHALLAPPPRSP